MRDDEILRVLIVRRENEEGTPSWHLQIWEQIERYVDGGTSRVVVDEEINLNPRLT